MHKFEVKKTFCGQHERYGDFFREWEIKTDCTREETLEYCISEIYKYYFSGYYYLQAIDGGFKFVICEPYDD